MKTIVELKRELEKTFNYIFIDIVPKSFVDKKFPMLILSTVSIKNSVLADNKVLQKALTIQISYIDKQNKDTANNSLTQWLDNASIIWQYQTNRWDEDSRLWEIIYEITLNN